MSEVPLYSEAQGSLEVARENVSTCAPPLVEDA